MSVSEVITVRVNGVDKTLTEGDTLTIPYGGTLELPKGVELVFRRIGWLDLEPVLVSEG